MTDSEKFLFDLRGYHVLPDVLTKDEVALANEAVETHEHLIRNRPAGLAQDSDELRREDGRGEFQQNPLTFDRPWCEPFRRMFAHERLIDVFNEILGPGFRLDHGPGLIRMKRGTEGHWLHGGTTHDPSQYHNFRHGRMEVGLCVAAWQLTEVRPGDGGFACVPGSHKSNFRVPADLPVKHAPPTSVTVPLNAGDVIVFATSLLHDATAWTEERPRLNIFQRYQLSVYFNEAGKGGYPLEEHRSLISDGQYELESLGRQTKAAARRARRDPPKP